MKLESHLRSLKALRLDKADPATWLYPLVESSLADETLRAWQRSSHSRQDGGKLNPPRTRLDLLMDFMKMEIQSDQQIALARTGFVAAPSSTPRKENAYRVSRPKRKEDVPTAAGLITSNHVGCCFCGNSHVSDRCIKAQSMTTDEKMKVVKEKRLCFQCLRSGHIAGQCKEMVRCVICGGKHYPILCNKLNASFRSKKKERSTATPESDVRPSEPANSTSSASNRCCNEILLNTVLASIKARDGSTVKVRVVGDTGSQRSHIKASVLQKLNCPKSGEEWIQNTLFGDSTTAPRKFGRYAVTLCSLNGSSQFNAEVLAEKQICGQIPKVPYGPWTEELQAKGINIGDVGEGCHDVDILIGNDYWWELATGRSERLGCGLVAVETKMGWTLGGRVHPQMNSALSIINSMTSTAVDIQDLWKLDVLGIGDRIERQSASEQEKEAIKLFRKTVSRDLSGRYVVALPWNGRQTELPTNRNVAEKRIRNVTTKLQKEKKFHIYDHLFRSWEEEGIISEVKNDSNVTGHYLPHRPVYKNSVTTPIRPVYDGSCKQGRSQSLNQCLYTGPNLLELVVSLLTHFRENEIGVSADIRKAFLMLSLVENDKDFVKFLWWKDESCKELKVYRHERVVFGLSPSPFLLQMVIAYHLEQYQETPVVKRLKSSFYVDNCLTSVSSKKEYDNFKREATQVMMEAKMELRQWCETLGDVKVEISDSEKGGPNSCQTEMCMSVLGVRWNRHTDTLSCYVKKLEEPLVLTKRQVLSIAAQVYDPIGFICPALLPLKQIIQKSWMAKSGWDDPLPDNAVEVFRKWLREMDLLERIEIKRHFQLAGAEHRELHVFSDASRTGYAAVAYLRTEIENKVSVQLLFEKSRLAPLSQPSIPRLELMGCNITARIFDTLREALRDTTIKCTFWCESSTVLAWIQRDGEWGVFVDNRAKEIVRISNAKDWRFVPGHLNPADLPSRGCSPSQLLQSKWWEGPAWLKLPRDTWPSNCVKTNEEEVNLERKKTTVLTVIQEETAPRFSSYFKSVAVWAYVQRVIDKARKEPHSTKRELSISELRKGEVLLIKQIQSSCFETGRKSIECVGIFRDHVGILRIRTRLDNRKDSENFKFPILLPNRHPMVKLLVMDFHLYHCHGGLHFMISKLREKYWILQCPRLVQKVIRECVKCRRHEAEHLYTEPAPLPESRVEDSRPFQTTGVDLAGPIPLRGGEKVWIVLYTCAVYRCVFLDLVCGLSTERFLGSLERFVATHGRPNTVYSDNGTNFVGASNIFEGLDWDDLEKSFKVRQIQWTFNPPTAAWWGGFWERLVRSIKGLLRRMLGRSRLSYDHMRTCLAGVAATINDRPLTSITEDDLIPLTPAMFLRGEVQSSFPETISAEWLTEAYQRMKKIQRQLQDRFRKEYLARLVVHANEKKANEVAVGDIVLVGTDNQKRFEWPMGRVVELCPGKDGNARVARVKTAAGELLRPLQRLYPLEIPHPQARNLASRVENKETIPVEVMEASRNGKESPEDFKGKISRYGRKIIKPARYSNCVVFCK